MAEKTTIIENRIKSANSWEEMQQILKDLPKTTLMQKIEEHREKKNMSIRMLSDFSLVPETTLYAIMADESAPKKNRRAPKKKQIIQIAFALSLSLEETQELLKLSKLKELYAPNKDDAIIMFGLSKGLDLGTIDELLEKQKCKTRFEEFRKI